MTRRKKRLIIISTIVIMIIILAILGHYTQKNSTQKHIEEIQNRVNQYTSLDDFKNLEEVMVYLNTTLISFQHSEQENIDYIVKAKFAYNLNIENKNYYEKLIHYTSHILQYRNFYIIDDENNIQILVICNSEKQIVNEYYINENKFYFNNLENKNNLEEYKKEEHIQEEHVNSNIEINTYCEILQNIISQNWKTNNINLGTKDSTYRNYDVYFDEGYEIRKVNGSVFNIVFTEKYTKNVYGNIKVNTSNDEIMKILGKPEFEVADVLGYKNEKFYIFFSKNQISIYPIIKYETQEIMEVVEKYNNSIEYNDYLNEIKSIWKDYDVNKFTKNEIILQYTLKGISFKYGSSNERGVILYNNYEGNVGKDNTLENILQNEVALPANISFRNKNLVFEHERIRINTLDDYTQYRNYATKNILNISNKFKVGVTEIQEGINEVRFISINKKCANTELRENINYGIWENDNTFIYSIKNRGIYKYNPETQQYVTVVEGVGDFVLVKIENSNLYYDNTYVQLEEAN